jgi:hypothetical protein
MDFGTKFTLVREGTLLADIAARAKDARPVLKQWGAYLKAGAKQAFIDKAPPLAPSTLAKQASTGTSAVTQQAKVRASYARSLDTALRRKGSTEAREDLRRLLSGDLSKGGGNRAVDRLRRRLLAAKKAKAAGMRLATGKTQLEKSKGVRGGKMGGAFRALIRRLGVIVENTAKFSRVHDEGGRVGNGAVLPAWGFMFISAKARAEMAEIALNWLLRGKKQ